MVGFPYYFHVNDGNSILKHPLYLKWNIRDIAYVDDNIAELKADIFRVMATNDNMPILWYLMSLYRTIGDLA